ncbi:hypothetical protein [Martelella mangrovi]|uniref:Uncharacterized protein n=1 Tax=Martelella mangrovi TaxID=1397477 RepID=A0ABV2I6L3_9HYPH|nr:hypothetical protein [uncultured Martelella sp.]
MKTSDFKALAIGLAVSGMMASSVFAWDLGDLRGVYTNADAELVSSFGFCGNGQGAAGSDGFMVNRTYTVEGDLVKMNANGQFVFTLSADKKELIPADDFTREWGAAEPYVLDTEAKIDC